MLSLYWHSVHHESFISVSPADAVLYTAREKEKVYPPDQDDAEVVQPYAAYSPAGQPKVRATRRLTEVVFKDPQCV